MRRPLLFNSSSCFICLATFYGDDMTCCFTWHIYILIVKSYSIINKEHCSPSWRSRLWRPNPNYFWGFFSFSQLVRKTRARWGVLPIWDNHRASICRHADYSFFCIRHFSGRSSLPRAVFMARNPLQVMNILDCTLNTNSDHVWNESEGSQVNLVSSTDKS